MKKTSSFLPILLIRTYVIMCIWFGGLTSVVEASPLDTIPPPITDFFIPVNQRVVEPVRNPGDFIGRVFAPKPEDWQTRPEAQPITGVTVTIASGPRAGESVATNPSGYYRFQNVTGDELHLRVEKERFEPKEVRVHRSRPTILANGDVPNYTKDPQQHPGNILIGHRWPDEIRFILEETLVVHDLLYVEGSRLPKGMELGGFYSLGVVVLYSYQYVDWEDEVGLLGTFAHEIAHAHQHATVSVDGSAWEIHGWIDTPEGRAYEEARRKDWAQVGKSPLDNIYGRGHGGGVALTETAAETCAHYWSVDRWGGRTAYGLLEVEAPHRYKWAEKWVPISIAVQPAPEVVSILDPNLAAFVRNELGLAPNAPITRQAMQRLTQLDARNRKIKDLTGLEHATRLRLLEVRQNQIRDIGALANLKNLTMLIIEENAVRDISPLTNMTQLTDLLIGNNPISDFTPLANLNQLERLSLWSVNIGDVTLLANKTKLTHLWSGRNNIRDITPLTNLTQLQLLYLPHNQISDVTPLAGLANLETLHLQDNSIRDISPLTGLTKLTDLRLGDNPITDKSPLRILKEQNPNLKVDIEIPPVSPVVHLEATQRPPLYWVDTTTGTLHRLVNDKVENFLPNAQNATSLAVDVAGGKLYWAEKTGNRTGRISVANLDGTNVKLVKNLTSVPLGIALDTVAGKLYLINSWGKVQRLNIDGSNFQTNLITGLEAPKHLALDVAGGQIYCIQQTSDTTGKIRSANLDGSNLRLVKDLTSSPRGLALDAVNKTLYLSNAYGKVQRLNFDGSNFQPNLITGLDAPKEVSVDVVGRKIYWTEQDGIWRADLNGENIEDVVTGLGAPTGIVLGTVPAVAPAAPAIADIPPKATVLLANYPNPFNPETWIPYQLSEPTEVTLHIYAINGTLIRTLALGHQPAGIYHSRSRAVYWDGKNETGEAVASGVYFYTFTADEFAATRKMLIRK